MTNEISRRDVLKLAGAGLGSLVVTAAGTAHAGWDPADPPPGSEKVNTLFNSLKPFKVGEPLAADEMRVSMMGTISPATERKVQVTSSVFVELGCGESFIFDAGMGCQINYTAMQVASSKMRKIFLTHLHGDHTSELTYMYCFGPQRDGKSPMYLWGPSQSWVRNPSFVNSDPDYADEPEFFDDGMNAFARNFREMNRWHTESQSFVGTRWNGAEGDGYDIVATELNWANGAKELPWSNNKRLNENIGEYFPWFSDEDWVAYHDTDRGIKISWFPAVHDRNGSVSYLLEWNGLSMIFSGDTRPNHFMLNALKDRPAPVDLLIHEMVIPADQWAAIAVGGEPSELAIKTSRAVQQNSHTPELALGYMLQEADKVGRAPRLAIATHFQATDSTIRLAFDAIRTWYEGPFSIAADLEVINVSSDAIRLRRAMVSDYANAPPTADPRARNGVYMPKYNDPRGVPGSDDEDEDSPYWPLGLGPLEQLSLFLTDEVVDACLYDPAEWECTMDYSAFNPPPDPPGL